MRRISHLGCSVNDRNWLFPEVSPSIKVRLDFRRNRTWGPLDCRPRPPSFRRRAASSMLVPAGVCVETDMTNWAPACAGVTGVTTELCPACAGVTVRILKLEHHASRQPAASSALGIQTHPHPEVRVKRASRARSGRYAQDKRRRGYSTTAVADFTTRVPSRVMLIWPI
jgi:Zn-finger nucleic acid-binding protein